MRINSRHCFLSFLFARLNMWSWWRVAWAAYYAPDWSQQIDTQPSHWDHPPVRYSQYSLRFLPTLLVGQGERDSPNSVQSKCPGILYSQHL